MQRDLKMDELQDFEWVESGPFVIHSPPAPRPTGYGDHKYELNGNKHQSQLSCSKGRVCSWDLAVIFRRTSKGPLEEFQNLKSQSNNTKTYVQFTIQGA